MTIVTYLLGAGASANSLPVVNQLNAKLLDLQTSVKMLHMSSAHVAAGKLEIDLEWLNTHLKDQLSIDTLAKKLYIAHEWDRAKSLEAILFVYFSYAQYTSKIDNRYDNFLASLINYETSKFPDNFKILSWNYDFQFEAAYSYFLKDKKLSSAKHALNIYGPNDNTSRSLFPGDFHLFKLNGSATYCDNGGQYFYIEDKFDKYDSLEILKKLSSMYDNIMSDTAKSGISFAWNTQNRNFIEKIQQVISNTTVLTVIGYTFPIFNRYVDRLLFEKESLPHLKKVYIQSKPDSIQDIKERFSAIRTDVDVILRTDTSQFTFPNKF